MAHAAAVAVARLGGSPLSSPFSSLFPGLLIFFGVFLYCFFVFFLWLFWLLGEGEMENAMAVVRTGGRTRFCLKK